MNSYGWRFVGLYPDAWSDVAAFSFSPQPMGSQAKAWFYEVTGMKLTIEITDRELVIPHCVSLLTRNSSIESLNSLKIQKHKMRKPFFTMLLCRRCDSTIPS
jgi:hypothetical protein